jgi:hypothetical protein
MHIAELSPADVKSPSGLQLMTRRLEMRLGAIQTPSLPKGWNRSKEAPEYASLN